MQTTPSWERGKEMPIPKMFINTDIANQRSSGPQARILITTSPNEYSNTPTAATLSLPYEPFTHDAPPPSYIEATTPNLYTGVSFSGEGARLLPFDEYADGASGEKWYQRGLRAGRGGKHWSKKGWFRRMVAVVVISVLVVGLVWGLAVGREGGGWKATVISAPAQAAEAETETEATPSSSSTPTASAQSKQVFPIRWPARCGKEYNVRTEELNFASTKELNILETVRKQDGPYKRVSGWIHIASAPTDQAAGTITARMSYAVSPSVGIDSVAYTTTSTGLTLGGAANSAERGSKRAGTSASAGTACLGVSVVIYMAAGVRLETLNVNSTNMGMQIHQGVNFSVTNSTSISLGTGTLDSVAFDSRETRLESISGSISGKYALADMVAIKTESGSVSVDIEPKPALDAASKAAIFKAESQAGSIRVDFERKHIPERDYQTYINTNVGSVDGTFIHGSKTVMKSVAGFLTADILPYKSGNYPSTIDTHTQSGQTSLTLGMPYKAKHVPMTGLVSTHTTTSGAVELKYPQEWEGYVNGTSMSGGLHLQGKDLELLDENNVPTKNYVEARKGTGQSSMTFATVSGGCEVQIGNI